MDDNGRIGGTKKVGGSKRTPRKPMNPVFVHHKANIARVGMEPKTSCTRCERSTTDLPRPLQNNSCVLFIMIMHVPTLHLLSGSYWQSTSCCHTTGLRPWFLISNQSSKVADSIPQSRSRRNRYKTFWPIYKNWSSSRHSRTERNAGSVVCRVERSALKEASPAKWWMLFICKSELWRNGFICVAWWRRTDIDHFSTIISCHIDINL